VSSEPGVPGDTVAHGITPGAVVAQPGTVAAPPPASRARSTAPVFLDARTLVVDYNCCLGRQHLVAFDLVTGRHSDFATVSSPVVAARRIGAGRLLVVTALRELAFVTRGRVRVVATGIAAATG
jgi:hypothetical protein